MFYRWNVASLCPRVKSARAFVTHTHTKPEDKRLTCIEWICRWQYELTSLIFTKKASKHRLEFGFLFHFSYTYQTDCVRIANERTSIDDWKKVPFRINKDHDSPIQKHRRKHHTKTLTNYEPSNSQLLQIYWHKMDRFRNGVKDIFFCWTKWKLIIFTGITCRNEIDTRISMTNCCQWLVRSVLWLTIIE